MGERGCGPCLGHPSGTWRSAKARARELLRELHHLFLPRSADQPFRVGIGMGITFYGIPNCDTVKKARQWLDARGMAYVFHDYKKQGADAGKLAGWVEQAGWEKVLNRAGATFKKLPDADKQGLDAA